MKKQMFRVSVKVTDLHPFIHAPETFEILELGLFGTREQAQKAVDDYSFETATLWLESQGFGTFLANVYQVKDGIVLELNDGRTSYKWKEYIFNVTS